MRSGPLIDALASRVGQDKEEGDLAYFHALTLYLEYIAKLIVAGSVACIGADPDRHRYTLEHGLVRADSLGHWVDTLNTALTGPSAQFFLPRATVFLRELTQRCTAGDWQYDVVKILAEAADAFSVPTDVGPRAAFRQALGLISALRNRTRGHGAVTSIESSRVCPLLEKAAQTIVTNSAFLKCDWAHLHRNLSGRYRVSPLWGSCEGLAYLRRTSEAHLPEGVCIDLQGPIPVSLVYSEPGARDVFLPNGNFKMASFELLSYVTNELRRQDGSAWSTPPGRLPSSETEGLSNLDSVDGAFANLPPPSPGYINRAILEKALRSELLHSERHPIVSLTGSGGIGKTTLAIRVIHDLLVEAPGTYTTVVWVSSRDIDLIQSGPKPVTPRVVRQDDIAALVVELLSPSGCTDKAFDKVRYVESCLRNGAAGRTLYVFDNFETLESPSDVFKWIDTHVRLPHKVLITTRHRDFAGDYVIDVGGMSDSEATRLIDQEGARLGIGHLITQDYKETLIDETSGHPYVIKILLGRVAQEGRASKPERIVATADHLLAALFERSFESLSPAAQRVFLLLCSWRVIVPAVAVEAVALRPGNERFDVGAALSELRRFSLIEEVLSSADGEPFVGVPLAASSFGRRKLEVSQFRVAVEEDRKLLMIFGAGRRSDVSSGVFPRVERLVHEAARRALDDRASADALVPILEYVASRVPDVHMQLADLTLELDGEVEGAPQAIRYLRKYLENSAAHDRGEVWSRIAHLSHVAGDAVGEIHALAEMALIPGATTHTLGGVANRINNSIRELKGLRFEDAWSPEVRGLIERVAEHMRQQVDGLSATECSRLSWLYLNISRPDSAREVAKAGCRKDPDNEYCRNLVERLGK